MKLPALRILVAVTLWVLAGCSSTVVSGGPVKGGTYRSSDTGSQGAAPAIASTDITTSGAVAGIHDAVAVCQDEVLSSSGILVAAATTGTSTGRNLANVLGYKNPVYLIAISLLPAYFTALQRDGLAVATRAIQAAASSGCAAQNNPVLTSTDVTQLANLASAEDAAILQQITFFGNGVTASQGAAAVAGSGPITDPVQVCAIENVAEVNIRIVDHGGTLRLGNRLSDSGHSQSLVATYFSRRFADGESAALDAVRSEATQLCSASPSQPVLSQQDVSDLMTIASPADAIILQRVTFFGGTTRSNSDVTTAQDPVPPNLPVPTSGSTTVVESTSGSNFATQQSSMPAPITPPAGTVTRAAAPDVNNNRDPQIDGPVSTGQPADPSLFYKQANSLGLTFTTPSGNITCKMMRDYEKVGTAAICIITTEIYPANPALHSGTCAGGDSVELASYGGSEAPAYCAPNLLFSTKTVLNYGQSLTWTGITCLSTKSGVKCESANQQGFVISQRELTTYN